MLFLLYLGRYWAYPPEPGSHFYLQDIIFPILSLYTTGRASMSIQRRRLHAFWRVLRYTRPHIVKQRHHPLEQEVLLCSLKPGDAEPTLSADLLIFCVSLFLRLSPSLSLSYIYSRLTQNLNMLTVPLSFFSLCGRVNLCMCV